MTKFQTPNYLCTIRYCNSAQLANQSNLTLKDSGSNPFTSIFNICCELLKRRKLRKRGLEWLISKTIKYPLGNTKPSWHNNSLKMTYFGTMKIKTHRFYAQTNSQIQHLGICKEIHWLIEKLLPIKKTNRQNHTLHLYLISSTLSLITHPVHSRTLTLRPTQELVSTFFAALRVIIDVKINAIKGSVSELQESSQVGR